MSEDEKMNVLIDWQGFWRVKINEIFIDLEVDVFKVISS